ncbi:NMDA receptor synaptonuclear signaling and neuronal migration factor isoform X1 [Canis lupus baileyi]|uniref:NMDA receptor synaptonuclear signaling and neuronal migration factor isoform X2 n=1 Tax=Canis lupus familiaris TaxID=9615 RepID=UPI000BAA1FD7|nr:NMDA receptor synaptonuclear signaling and neuronal migration factor isoform X2 [Canis lupus familiaris]XP_025331793.1 NMDA receptor synaptonuclear signaling and neuronal migration factor isoform X1 [Canis lupus dingo]XP_038404529.1 NMDA receptor synaptonuclear signaling and neuronal migration factor isoform X2 [Canis lupus familiaris]XP_038533746.1 NMDA receptor synaptonuclear signaling and neuronal migration factor isoform X2 [Canis lupus familiaris]|eukprot:XP_022279216.1 NMDA receptor synaptonuclear signaling and neuronal migration factor isoform X2 [Canis lupus familiaris]
MGAAASRRRALRSEAMSSVAAKVRAARAFGEYLSQSHPENRNGADHLLADAYSGHDGSPEMQPAPQNKRRLSLVSNGRYEGSLSEEAVGGQPASEGPQPRVYTISGEPALLPSPEAEAIELAVVKGRRQRERHPHHHSQPLRASPGGSREDVSRSCQSWAGSRQGSKECPGCAQLAPGPSPSPRTFGLDQPPLPEATNRRKKLERMYSVDRVSDDVPIRTWFPKENLFSFHTATTTMQAADSWWFPRVFRGYAERKRRKRENDSASVIQRNFRKHLRMVGSRRVKAQSKTPGRWAAFAERRERSFSRSWSDPTPMKADTSHDSRDSSDLQSSHCTLGEAFEDLDWETEKGLEAVACDTEGFVPPKVMLISSKVPKAEYIPTIIRRDDPSIIPILYDHEHATFEDILEEIEKKLNVYHKGAKIWKMLIFCQGGPGHLYLLKNKVATFAKVEKEEDMIHFWKRLSRLMSKVNPEPNIIHIMGCYILGNPNGEKLFQNLRSLMTPYRVTFESPLELSAQGKQMIETYFDFRLYRLWKSRQHSKLLDFEDVL